MIFEINSKVSEEKTPKVSGSKILLTGCLVRSLNIQTYSELRIPLLQSSKYTLVSIFS
jgi:hypothetical protein